MSEYTTSSVTIGATPTNQEQIRRILSEQVGASCHWVSGRQLAADRRTLAMSNRASELAPIFERAVSLPPTTCGDLAMALELAEIAKGHRDAINGNRPSDSSLRAVAQRLDHSERVMLRAERTATTRLAHQGLVGIGYSVRSAESENSAAIEARRGHSVLLVQVRPGGQMHMDWAGHSGGDCEQDMSRVRKALAAEGLHVAVRRQQRHGNPAGGSLIARAARAGNGDLVAGALAADDPFGPPTGTPARSGRLPLPEQ